MITNRWKETYEGIFKGFRDRTEDFADERNPKAKYYVLEAMSQIGDCDICIGRITEDTPLPCWMDREVCDPYTDEIGLEYDKLTEFVTLKECTDYILSEDDEKPYLNFFDFPEYDNRVYLEDSLTKEEVVKVELALDDPDSFRCVSVAELTSKIDRVTKSLSELNTMMYDKGLCGEELIDGVDLDL